jgi:hypothetical protein
MFEFEREISKRDFLPPQGDRTVSRLPLLYPTNK